MDKWGKGNVYNCQMWQWWSKKDRDACVCVGAVNSLSIAIFHQLETLFSTGYPSLGQGELGCLGKNSKHSDNLLNGIDSVKM